MSATHDLDSAGAATATAWATDVDDTVNRLSGLTLGRLTNVAGTNAITGRLPLSTGFTAISTGATFSFVTAAANTGAVTLQLKDSGGTNVGSSFALRDETGTAFASGALASGQFCVFQYDAVEGYARLINPPPPEVVQTDVYAAYQRQSRSTDLTLTSSAATVFSFTYTMAATGNEVALEGTLLVEIDSTGTVDASQVNVRIKLDGTVQQTMPAFTCPGSTRRFWNIPLDWFDALQAGDTNSHTILIEAWKSGSGSSFNTVTALTASHARLIELAP